MKIRSKRGTKTFFATPTFALIAVFPRLDLFGITKVIRSSLSSSFFAGKAVGVTAVDILVEEFALVPKNVTFA